MPGAWVNRLGVAVVHALRGHEAMPAARHNFHIGPGQPAGAAGPGALQSPCGLLAIRPDRQNSSLRPSPLSVAG